MNTHHREPAIAGQDSENTNGSALIRANQVNKFYGRTHALRDVSFTIPKGRIVGLVGPNGSGKTTLLKSIMGLLHYTGELDVMGLEPQGNRTQLISQLSSISDVSVIPKWIRVSQLLEFCRGVHPNFREDVARGFLAQTEVREKMKVSQLSKGMKTQLHLALAMAIEAPLMVLDEPTLGLDILYRKQFYNRLLNDFFNENRTVLVSTHQVEEIEQILTDVIFLRQGQVVLQASMDEVATRFHSLACPELHLEDARALRPIGEVSVLGQTVMLFDGASFEALSEFGEVKTPSLTDIFVALMQRDSAQAEEVA
jgi:ABC-2 type transport system ATP-binding protein